VTRATNAKFRLVCISALRPRTSPSTLFGRVMAASPVSAGTRSRYHRPRDGEGEPIPGRSTTSRARWRSLSASFTTIRMPSPQLRRRSRNSAERTRPADRAAAGFRLKTARRSGPEILCTPFHWSANEDVVQYVAFMRRGQWSKTNPTANGKMGICSLARIRFHSNNLVARTTARAEEKVQAGVFGHRRQGRRKRPRRPRSGLSAGLLGTANLPTLRAAVVRGLI
jgi:hypothetical protein